MFTLTNIWLYLLFCNNFFLILSFSKCLNISFLIPTKLPFSVLQQYLSPASSQTHLTSVNNLWHKEKATSLRLVLPCPRRIYILNVNRALTSVEFKRRHFGNPSAIVHLAMRARYIYIFICVSADIVLYSFMFLKSHALS